MILTNNISAFRKYGCQIIPVGGKSEIIKPLAMAKLLNIPVFVICDADTDKEEMEDEERRKSEVTKHKKDNKSILNLLGYNTLDEWCKDTIVKDDLYMWNTNLTKIIDNELGDNWKKYLAQSYNFYGNPGGLKKNPLSIARALKLAWDDEVKSNTLIRLTKRIIDFASKK